jgi:hypothetical protein
MNGVDIRPLNNPGSDDVERMVYKASRYFAENPDVLGVELFVTHDDGTSTVIGYVRNPAMKSLFADVHQIMGDHARNTKPRTVEVRPKP